MKGIDKVHSVQVQGECLGNVGGIFRFDVRKTEYVKLPLKHGFSGEIISGC